MSSYVVKARIGDLRRRTLLFPRMKTMYGGKTIAAGDEVFLFASGREGAAGLVARGVVAGADAVKKPRGAERWTARVSIAVRVTARAKRPLGREELKAWRKVKDGSPQAELDFKFYRQATDKIGGISQDAARFLKTFF